MRILCIDDSTSSGLSHRSLKYGETYEATGEILNKSRQVCYFIPGLPDSYDNDVLKPNKAPLYRKSRFIPLSDIDEKELVEAREEETTIPLYGF